MSWDIFVQELPAGIRSVTEIPDDFRPGIIGGRSMITRKIQEVVPSADFADPAWGKIDGSGYSIEINLGDQEELEGFAFHVRGDDGAASVVAAILNHLQLRALDPSSESGLFEPGAKATKSLHRWRLHRDSVV